MKNENLALITTSPNQNTNQSKEYVEKKKNLGRLNQPKTSDDWLHDLELFEERAAIREFDGGMTRADAEAAASDDVKRWRETWGKR